MIRSRDLPLLAVLGASCGTLTGCPQGPCADCFDSDGYEIDLSSLESGTKPPAAVLFSGWRNGRCQDDVVCTGNPNVFLGDVRWGDVEWSRDCSPDDQEIIAFAGGHAPSRATPTVPARTGVKLEGSVNPVSFSGPLTLDVRLWAVADPELSGAEYQAQAAEAIAQGEREWVIAAQVFSNAGTGIQLSFKVDSFPWHNFPPEAEGTLPENSLRTKLRTAASCSSSLVQAIQSTEGGYDAGQLNVYYVKVVQGYAALNCYGTGPGGNGPQNIMFVQSTTSYSEYQLAHELGHALGLLRSAPTPGARAAELGHVDEMYLDPYLASDNLMRSGGEDLHQITLGQIYRMHFDELSWQWVRPGAPAHENGYPRSCQASPVSGGKCPPLTLHPVRGWP